MSQPLMTTPTVVQEQMGEQQQQLAGCGEELFFVGETTDFSPDSTPMSLNAPLGAVLHRFGTPAPEVLGASSTSVVTLGAASSAADGVAASLARTLQTPVLAAPNDASRGTAAASPPLSSPTSPLEVGRGFNATSVAQASNSGGQVVGLGELETHSASSAPHTPSAGLLSPPAVPGSVTLPPLNVAVARTAVVAG